MLRILGIERIMVYVLMLLTIIYFYCVKNIFSEPSVLDWHLMLFFSETAHTDYFVNCGLITKNCLKQIK